MKPEILAVLNSIGYQQALVYDRSISLKYWDPEKSSSKIWPGKTQAHSGQKDIYNVFKALNDLPSHIVERWETLSKTTEDWDSGRSPFHDTLKGLVQLQQQSILEIETSWAGSGRSKDYRAYDTARKIAEIYILGTGKMPTKGADSEGAPTGEFCKAVDQVFRLAGYSANFRRFAEAAVDWVKENDNEVFNSLISLRNCKGQRMSILTGRLPE